MNPEVGFLITVEMKRRRTGPSVWAEEHGFNRRSVNEVLHHDMGGKRGGPATQAIMDKLIEESYIDENHQLIESARKAS